MWHEKIAISGPYNFDRVLERLSIDPLNVVSINHQSVKVPIFVKEQPSVVEVQATGTTDDPSFIMSGEDIINKEQAIEKVRGIFQWDIPLRDVHHHFQKTKLRDLFSEHYGTPLVLDFDPYGCLLKCIIHQQLNMAFAHTLSTRFVKTYGFEVDGVWFYPRPEVVADIKVERLRELQFSSRKAEYVIGIGRAIAQGELNFEKIRQLSDEEILAQLVKLRGVGPWTVQNFLMFGLGRPNLFPIADIGIQNALKKLYSMERKPTKEEMENFILGWEPYLSYASLYLWRSIE